MDNDYISKIIKKLDTIEDKELRKMIEQLIGERQELNNTAKLDPLTGLYNRNILNEVISYSAIVMCDVDDFKKINDTFGHDFGDEVLKLVAKTLKSNTRSNDIVCRYGGDEFLVIFKDCLLDVVVNRMKKIQKDIDGENLKSKVTLSIGISEYKDGLELLDAIKRADEALYYSKKSGKKIVSVYDDIKNNI
ncbi:MAG: GGDEF domain-containing protein [Bacilli bacterium]|nr:GGDEF domain-containing protein [Bacilli bacterium]MBQ6283044.1 GGDEF domain-containing protein [Bacilli bacterium]